MDSVVDEREYQLKSRHQIRSIMKSLFCGALLILAIGIFFYLLLFILILLI